VGRTVSHTGSTATFSRRPTQRPSGCDPTYVIRIDPADGADGVFRDACVLAKLSAPADPATLSTTTFRIEDPAGTVPARLRLSPDRLILIWAAERLLVPGVAHVVRSSGLLDAHGKEVLPHRSCFIPCDLTSTDWPP
jgi:hypothetical protein